MAKSMSIWTSKSLIAAAFLLSACSGGGLGGGLGTGIGGASAVNAPLTAVVTSDRVVVAGPEGYCVDQSSLRATDDTGFVLLGNCAAITNSRRAAQPATPSVLTAAVSGPGDSRRIEGNLGAMDSFFRSEEGLRLLSRGQDPSSVTILDSAIEGGAFLLHARDSSEASIQGVQPEYWRAYMDIGNRIATLSVLGLEGRELSATESQQTLRSFIQAMRSANFGAPPPAEPQQSPLDYSPRPTPPATELRPLWNIGLLRRIFG